MIFKPPLLFYILAILVYLVKTDRHPTADDIYTELFPIFPNISVATVYNNLRVFKSVGLIQELTYGDASSRFEFVTTPHYHIICNQCGKIADLSMEKEIHLRELAEKTTDFTIQSYRLEFYGLCSECKNKNS